MHSIATEIGIGPGYVISSYRPDNGGMPLGQQGALGLLGLTVVGVVILLSLGQGRALRPYSAAIEAIGLPLGWARKVVRYQVLITVGIGTLGAAAAVGVSMIIFVVANPEQQPIVPWAMIAVLLLTVAASTIVGQLAGTARLRIAERGQ